MMKNVCNDDSVSVTELPCNDKLIKIHLLLTRRPGSLYFDEKLTYQTRAQTTVCLNRPVRTSAFLNLYLSAEVDLTGVC